MVRLPLRNASAPLCLLALLLGPAGPANAADWANWRGPHHNGVSDETGLIDSWDPKGGDGSNVLWRSEAIRGRSTPIVSGGRLYTLMRDQPETELEGEKVVCADAKTGDILWEHRFNVYLSDVPDTRVGWSSVTADPETGRVYAQGVCGYFCCLDGESGQVVWERSLHEELGLLSTYGGRTNFPLIYEDTVITSAVVIGWGDSKKWGLLAKPAHRFMGFDKATGELRWLSGTRLIPYDTTYSTPSLVKLAGQQAMVFGSGDGAVWAMQPGTGKTLWKCNLSRRGLNVSPVVAPDGRVFTGHSEENLKGNAMGAFAAIDGTRVGEKEPTDLTAQELWKNYQQMVGKSSPLFIGDRVYAVNDSAKLLVLDSKTGEQLARATLGRVMRGSPVYADGKIYACSRGGRFAIYRPTGSGVELVSRTSLRGEQVDASPIVADGRVYLTTSEATYCLGKPPEAQAGKKQPPQPAKPADEITDKRVARVELLPAKTSLLPGESQQYRLRLYNAEGQSLGNADPSKISFGISGTGDITREGVYTAPKNGSQTALVLCEYNDFSCESQVRILDQNVAQVQLTPWDSLLAPGEEVRFKARLYNAAGKFLRVAKADEAQFVVSGAGQITPEGVYTAPDKSGHETALVLCECQGLAAEARVRVTPPLPWSFDFEDGAKDVPLTWVGGRVRYVMREADGAHYLAKPTELPTRPGRPTTKLGTRSRMWMGSHELSNYTVQADIQLQEGVGGESAVDEAEPEGPPAVASAIKLPTAGLLNSRYTFALFGPSQEARLYSWCTHDRRTQAVQAMELKSGVWYRMKLTVIPNAEEGTATVQAKVWPRGEAEPGAWTLEFVDKAPNLQGSPGLFGDAKEAEFYVDNLTVTPN